MIGEHTRKGSLVVNVIKTKKLTNMRSGGSDERTSIVPAIKPLVDEAKESFGEDEYVEVIPKHICLRKIT